MYGQTDEKQFLPFSERWSDVSVYPKGPQGIICKKKKNNLLPYKMQHFRIFTQVKDNDFWMFLRELTHGRNDIQWNMEFKISRRQNLFTLKFLSNTTNVTSI